MWLEYKNHLININEITNIEFDYAILPNCFSKIIFKFKNGKKLTVVTEQHERNKIKEEFETIKETIINLKEN